jgi:hypothetical protein
MAFHIVAELDNEINWNELNTIINSHVVANIEFFPIVNSSFYALGISILKDGFDYNHFSSLKEIIQELRDQKFRVYELYYGKELCDDRDFFRLEKLFF